MWKHFIYITFYLYGFGTLLHIYSLGRSILMNIFLITVVHSYMLWLGQCDSMALKLEFNHAFSRMAVHFYVFR